MSLPAMSSRIAAGISRRGIYSSSRGRKSALPFNASLASAIRPHTHIADSAHWREKNCPLPLTALFGNRCTLFSTFTIYDDIDANTGNRNVSDLTAEYSTKDEVHVSDDDLTLLRYGFNVNNVRSAPHDTDTESKGQTQHTTQSNHSETTLQKSQLLKEKISKTSNTDSDSTDANSTIRQKLCIQSEPLIPPNTPLPPPLPKPKYSFRCRNLPPNLLAFNSPDGKQHFLNALQTNNAEAYFPLSQQFLNQMDPAYCGISTLVLILNALAMDPNVRWRGGWRWYGDESMLLERCCLEEERVRREGITMEQYCGLARCHGVDIVMKRPAVSENDIVKHEIDVSDDAVNFSLETFRRDIINAVQNPPLADWDDVTEDDTNQQSKPQDRTKGGYFLVTSFARHALQQTGDGHFSPIAAYHPPTDSCLVLDVARFKYAPYWVSVAELYKSMIPPDKATGKSRGWILMYPPAENASEKKRRHRKEQMSEEELEGKRPAACVPLAGSGERICPVETIKIDYCSVGK